MHGVPDDSSGITGYRTVPCHRIQNDDFNGTALFIDSISGKAHVLWSWVFRLGNIFRGRPRASRGDPTHALKQTNPKI